MSKDPVVYLVHIYECVQKIEAYTEGIKQEEFLENELIQDAVIRNLEIIGEATKKLPNILKEKYPDIEWKKVAGMRDKLIHDYIGVDIWAVWAVVEDILPEFKIRIENIIQREQKEL